jgi:methionyl-tRNA formyltransferase
VFVNAQGGMIEILKLKPQGGKKMGAAEFAQAQGWPQS